jgi:hypothetical protein
MSNYNTEDIYLAAFLSTESFPVVQWKRDIGLTKFTFEQSAELSQLVGEYYADRVTTSPLQFGNALKNLKSMIHSKQNEFTSHHDIGATRK